MAESAGQVKVNRLAYFYTMPAFFLMGLMIVYPFIYNVVISFSNMNLSHFRDWHITGLGNYLQVVSGSSFWYFFFKTVLWTVLNVVFHVGIGVGLALLLNKDIKGKSIFRTLLILPWAVPQYITALTWRGMFNSEYGAVNLLLDRALGLTIPWLTTEWGAFAACLITNIWLGFPFMMIIALGGLQSIPDELYEAAEIDGSSWWHKLHHITIPLLRPVMVPAITLGVIWTFNNFNVVWLVSNGGEPSDKTHILVSWIYKSAFTYFRMGYAAAFSMVLFGILLLFSWNFIKKTRATEAVY
ncbi:MAG: Maltose transport system permease protein MalF [bacterium ADurb.Bin431]|nr:MAG: Maltose transport system permease protein MalF [bacterium ADurb.Bin431]HNY92514.1 sugar ABC transporter permease [bacterium]HOH08884.1 sugar ABC transporter permease [bacterium]